MSVVGGGSLLHVERELGFHVLSQCSTICDYLFTVLHTVSDQKVIIATKERNLTI